MAAIGLLAVLAVLAASAIRVVGEHEQGLVTRLGRHLAMLGPGLHVVVPLVDRIEKVDLRTLLVVSRVEPRPAMGRIRVGGEDRDARTDDAVGIGPGTPIRIVSVEAQVIVVTAA